MKDLAKLGLLLARANSSYGEPAPGFAENAIPWIAGFYAVMVPFIYREFFRLMFWARSMNW
jgi:hypothetical protein